MSLKILFIHGLASSGSYKTAASLRILLRPCEVIAPDVPIHPLEALPMLRRLCSEEQPDLIVGLSLGGFWAQKLRGYRKVCINPDLHPSSRLGLMMGENAYLSPRKDGATSFLITPEICDAYTEVEHKQMENLTDQERAITIGLFADNDELVDCHKEFAMYYPDTTRRYPGRHLPTFPELRDHILSAVRQLL